MKLREMSDDALAGALAATRRDFESVRESSGHVEALRWVEDDIWDICREFTRRGLESDTVTVLEL